jgi:hypothetical protein
MFLVAYTKDFKFIWIKFHRPISFSVFKTVEIFLEGLGIDLIVRFTIYHLQIVLPCP